MDIQTVIHKTAMWAVTSALFVVPIGFVMSLAKPWIDHMPMWQFMLLVGGLFLLMIPYMRIVQPKIDHLFQRRLYNLRSVLDSFVRDVAIVKSMPELAEKVVAMLQRVLYTEPTTLLLWHAKEQLYGGVTVGQNEQGLDVGSIDAGEPWLRWLSKQDHVVELAEAMAGSDKKLADIARRYATKTDAVMCVPLHRDGQLIGIINVGPKRNLKRFAQAERDFLETLRVELSIALTNSLLYDEVKQMSEELRQWGVQLEQKVEDRTKELQTALHQLRETESQLIQSEKLAAHGLLAAGVLHEINNPLSFSRGSLSVLKKALMKVKDASQGAMGPLLGEVERAAEIIQHGHERIASIVQDLKTFARQDVQGVKPTNLHDGLDATISLLSHEMSERIRIHREYGEIGLIEASPGQINQVFLNLLQNAVQMIDGLGDITIRTWREEETLFVSIKDSGPGIAPDVQKRIFEPFFTTKPVGQGTGLGLSVSHQIVSEHGGRLTVRSEVGQGAEFLIELPVGLSIAVANGQGQH